MEYFPPYKARNSSESIKKMKKARTEFEKSDQCLKAFIPEDPG